MREQSRNHIKPTKNRISLLLFNNFIRKYLPLSPWLYLGKVPYPCLSSFACQSRSFPFKSELGREMDNARLPGVVSWSSLHAPCDGWIRPLACITKGLQVSWIAWCGQNWSDVIWWTCLNKDILSQHKFNLNLNQGMTIRTMIIVDAICRYGHEEG